MSYSHSSVMGGSPPGPATQDGVSPVSPGFSLKRLYDLFFSALGLLVLCPLFLVIAAAIKVADGGPVFYRQSRIGWRGRRFLILKFRTMVPQAESMGPCVTRDGDQRITGLGRLLRQAKLDELPQLWNVLKGEMSLVGPRPEVPKYVAQYTAAQRSILELKPGITDLASLHFRNEELLLKHARQLEAFYLEQCIPRKLQLNLEYARRANLLTDTWIIVQTICPYWICLMTVYSLVLTAAFWLACLLIYDFALPPWPAQDIAGALGAVVALQLALLIWNKQWRGLLSYFSLAELRQLAVGLAVSGLLLLGLRTFTGHPWPPVNLVLLDSILALGGLCGLRLLLRFWRERSSVDGADAAGPPRRVGIIGAGETGSRVARELLLRKGCGRIAVAFFDDDLQKWRRCIHDIPVVGLPECLLEGWARELDEVVIALPNAAAQRLREISELVRQAGLKAYTAPSVRTLWPKSEPNS